MLSADVDADGVRKCFDLHQYDNLMNPDEYDAQAEIAEDMLKTQKASWLGVQSSVCRQ